MSTEAMVTMLVAWGYILATLIYLFTKIFRKERERKKGQRMDEWNGG